MWRRKIRNPKHETNSNDRNPKFKTGLSLFRALGILDLAMVSNLNQGQSKKKEAGTGRIAYH